MDKNRKGIFNKLFKSLLKLKESIDNDYPLFCKPMILIIMVLGFIICSIILIPLYPIIRKIYNNSSNSYIEMERELVTVWRTESNKKALNLLRDIYKKLLNGYGDLSDFTGIKIEPYGKFKWNDFLRTSKLLYHWEMQHQNYREANSVSEFIISEYFKENIKINKWIEQWIVYHAKTKNLIDGNINAQKYLMQYLDPKKKKSLIKEFLYELRKE